MLPFFLADVDKVAYGPRPFTITQGVRVEVHVVS